MKFGKYLDENKRTVWATQYVDYKALKDLIKDAAATAEVSDWDSSRVTSLSVARIGQRDQSEEKFFRRLEQEVAKVGQFTQQQVASLKGRLEKLSSRAHSSKDLSSARREELLEEAKQIGDEFLQLEKYVNLNYMACHKILKKHDKLLPKTPCRQFYISHLHQQPWIQGNFSDMMVILSGVFSELRGDTLAEAQAASAQAFNRSTTKYWVRTADVSAVKRIIIENMPVFVFNAENYSGDAQLVNSVYFDNDSLELYHGRLDKKPGALAVRVRWYGPSDPQLCFIERKTHRESWKGEKSVKERFTLPEHKVVPYLEGDYTAEQFEADLRARGKGAEDVAKASKLFREIQTAIDSKQLKPFVRTQYMRSAFQMGHDRSVSFTLDTNLVMLKENPEGHPSCAISGRWYRDPALPITRTEITRFPHAVLEIKLALPEGESPPEWVADLMDSGLITEVHKMSKFIHGTAALFPEMVRAVPYWMDDESIRDSILACAPDPHQIDARARDAGVVQGDKPRKRGQAPDDAESLQHPLLGEAPTLQLMDGSGEGAARPLRRVGAPAAGGGWLAWLGLRPRGVATAIPMRLEPKTFLASERTFLSWMHMAITLASIATALLAFAGASKQRLDPLHRVGGNLVLFVAFILLPLAIFIVAYAAVVFTWRSRQIALKQASYIDDRRGPYLLVVLVVLALSAIFVASSVDLITTWRESKEPGFRVPILTAAQKSLFDSLGDQLGPQA
ncbi:hypothetical protein QBZ16_000518 [Prototheca wickerhamii]|uniref:SPX domain-containing protein n=1 Tax=Prototheca wickerhamii TaxID=3111 RepID=A0AAD9INI1_PROWI|nr:hypothetical protein QBZ16_000518 [Prototheca wickerhamii]